ncbi:virulence RhuM family protein [Pseudoalteromonas fuliginea]|uniref:Hydroxyacid dehydrogenase n=1 Tax=Pseudoalteromonas fuliginea TaxID=1872678 RepID=A0ABQ6RIB4_9GAMM|nr:virulence RhuM family protein [Pseudoalteromonas fuliginea]KAA1156615.1 hydroxyacid dehydrogenase [Pseudoalteromonas fuliginea]KAA1167444.1 hydroxyacid dehydrogenase [Pseudoalteromonas fuliginea]
MTNNVTPPLGQFILFETGEGQTKVECRFETETLWLTQNLIAELYQKSVPTINEHLSNIYNEGELEQNATIRNFRIVRKEGTREVARDVAHYNLEAILAVGYRVRSKQGTQFRQWATQTLQEYLIKGFVMDDERLKNPDNMQYFDELLNRIRDIRSSEKIFWRKVCDIYATSIDYDGKAQTSVDFFAKVQNKMHWAAHGNTAAELVFKRIDADKPHLGLTSFAGTEPTRKEVVTGKNYLNEQELDTLNRLVNSYLEFAELQARNGKLMKMADWASKLDDFLRLSDYEVLNHAGNISQAQATEKAKQEYDKYRRVIDAQPSKVDLDLANALKQLQGKPAK